MINQAEPDTLEKCHVLALWTCGIALLIGVLGIVGWIWDIQAFKSTFPSWTSIKFNTALSITLLALIQLLYLHHRGKLVGRLLAGFIFLIGILTLLEWILGWNFGIDQLVFKEAPGDVGTLTPGRMSFGAALSCFLLGFALVLPPQPYFLRLRQYLAESVILISALGIFAYLYGASPLASHFTLSTTISFNATFALLLLCAGILLAHPEIGHMRIAISRTPGGVILRRFLPAIIGGSIVMGWIFLEGYRRGFYDVSMSIALLVTTLIVFLTILAYRSARNLFEASLALEGNIRELKHRRELLSEAQRLARVGSWEYDLDTHRMIWSQEEYRLLGYDPQIGLPTLALMIERIHPEDRSHFAAMLERIDSKHPQQFDHRVVHPDGKVLILHSILRGVADNQGGVVRILGTSQDVTELRQADRVKDEFLSVISHELRTPLNAVIGFGSILEDRTAGPLTHQQQDFVKKILSGGDRMLGLIDDLLDIARMQAGKFGITVENTDYPSLIKETVDSFAPDAGEKGLTIETEVDVPLPVCLDRRRIQQLIANLLSNAIKFTPQGGKIQVRSFVQDHCLVTEVSDNGIGISPEDLPKLFSPFKQLDMSMTRRAGGVGLGLSIAKAIAEAHSGRIEAESKLGKESTFRFYLPVGEAKACKGSPGQDS